MAAEGRGPESLELSLMSGVFCDTVRDALAGTQVDDYELSVLPDLTQYTLNYKSYLGQMRVNVDRANGYMGTFLNRFAGTSTGEFVFDAFVLRPTDADVAVTAVGAHRHYLCDSQVMTLLFEPRTPRFTPEQVVYMIPDHVPRPVMGLTVSGALRNHMIGKMGNEVFVTPEMCKHHDLVACVFLTHASGPPTVACFKRLRNRSVDFCLSTRILDGVLHIAQVTFLPGAGPGTAQVRDAIDDAALRRSRSDFWFEVKRGARAPPLVPRIGAPPDESAADRDAADWHVIDSLEATLRVPPGTELVLVEVIRDRIRVHCVGVGCNGYMFKVPFLANPMLYKHTLHDPIQINVSANNVIVAPVPDLATLSRRLFAFRSAPGTS